MTYSDFTLERVEAEFNLKTSLSDLFPALPPHAVPPWLQDLLGKGRQLALVSEKARSEFIVAPILLASRELSGNLVAVYSGQRLDVLPQRGLVGECDFILTLSPPVPVLHAPLITIVEAKKNDVESGLGQCAAQMVGARLLNERDGWLEASVYGCVTTGEAWQFLELRGEELRLDRQRFYIDNVGGILAVFQAIIARFQPA